MNLRGKTVRGRERVRACAQQAKVRFERGLLVPLHHRALNLEEGKSNRRLPVLWTFEDEVVEGVADLGVLAGVGICEW